MDKNLLIFATVLGLINVVLALSSRLANYKVLEMDLGMWFFFFRYLWRFIVVVEVWYQYGEHLRLIGILPVVGSFAYDIYLVLNLPRLSQDIPHPTPATRFGKMTLFTLLPFMQGISLLIK